MTSTTALGTMGPRLSEAAEHVVLAADDSFGTIAAAGWLAARAKHRRMTIEIAVVEGHVRAGQHTGSSHQIGEGVAWGMREYVSDTIPGVSTTVRVLAGEPVAALRAASSDHDLLVIGCNRTGFWHRLPIATRSTRIAEVAVRPTVVVPSTWLPGPGVVLAAVSGVATQVVDWAADEAASTGRGLDLVHGDLLPAGVPSVRMPGASILEDAERRMLATHLARVRAAHPDLQVRIVLEHEGVVRGLVERVDAVTIVIGTRTQDRPRTGAVMRGVLELATCPVVVIPVDHDDQPVGDRTGSDQSRTREDLHGDQRRQHDR